MENIIILGEYLGRKYEVGAIEWREFPTGLAKSVLGAPPFFDSWCQKDLSTDALVAMTCQDMYTKVDFS